MWFVALHIASNSMTIPIIATPKWWIVDSRNPPTVLTIIVKPKWKPDIKLRYRFGWQTEDYTAKAVVLFNLPPTRFCHHIIFIHLGFDYTVSSEKLGESCTPSFLLEMGPKYNCSGPNNCHCAILVVASTAIGRLFLVCLLSPTCWFPGIDWCFSFSHTVWLVPWHS